ncbi:MAG: glycosyltransferase family 9 protein [Flectobacillus sp.]|nr:glycosyltransferase family 9 protein [Flectobacillus sp.]
MSSQKRILKVFWKVTDVIYTFLHKHLSKKKSPSNRIIIFSQDRIGDNLLKVRIFQEYLSFFNDYDITFIIIKDTEEIAKTLGLNYVIIDRKAFSLNIFYRYKFLRQFHSLAPEMLIFTSYCFENDAISTLLSYIKVACLELQQNQTYLNAQRILFEKVTSIPIDIESLSQDDKVIQSLIPVLDIPFDKPIIVFGIGALHTMRYYPAQKMVVVIEHFVKLGYQVCLLGKGRLDESYVQAIFAIRPQLASQIFNGVSNLSLLQSFSIIQNADLFIGVESGLLQACYLLNKKGIAIYGGGHFGVFKHSNSNLHYIYDKLPCFGCNWEQCDKSNLNKEPAFCIDQISPLRIIETAQKILTHDSALRTQML